MHRLQRLTLAPLFYHLTCLALLGLLLFPRTVQATHMLAGQIYIQKDTTSSDPNAFIVTLTTYSDPSEAGVDRCSATIIVHSSINNSVVATLEDIPRANGDLVAAPADCPLTSNRARDGVRVKGPIKRNVYITKYVFPGPGEYTFLFYDIARKSDVINITNSGDKSFTVTTEFTFAPIIGGNNTPILKNEPLDDACLGKLWTHNPGGFDIDGDSLAYKLVPCLFFEENSPFIPGINPESGGYFNPDDPSRFSNGPMTMDPLTGIITWDAPIEQGIYNISYYVEEWRNGVLIGVLQRDMAIFVENCKNNPPVIETITDTCVYAGDVMEFGFLSYDPDSTDSLYFQLNNGALGNNGPFAVENAATISGEIQDATLGVRIPYLGVPVSAFNNNMNPPDTVYGTVRWETNCDNIRSGFYQVDFYATDNKRYAREDVVGITTLTANAAVKITVIPPSPQNLLLTKASRGIQLSWEPTNCPDRVLGYNVYRKLDGDVFGQDSICCDQTPLEAGYELLTYIEGVANVNYMDSLLDVEGRLGEKVCYAITAIYADPLIPQLPAVESCAANACAELDNGQLYLYNDSVSITDPVNGEIFLSWSQPVIDSIFPRPLTYRLYRANNNSFPAIEIAQGIDFGDTTYFDRGLDTDTRGYNYRVEVYDATDQIVNTSEIENVGSSIYLTTTGGGNNYIDLSWSEYVPWQNAEYIIFRSINGGPYEALDTLPGTGANTHTYRDSLLSTQQQYCYFIRSIGSYSIIGNLKDPLINDSQISCDLARDDEPPCNVAIQAVGDCDRRTHQVTLTKSTLDCDLDAKVVQLLYSPNETGPFEAVLTLPYESFGDDTTVLFSFSINDPNFSGCYTATVADSFGNTSNQATPICIDYCVLLELPNIFTPNGDNLNDVFKPVRYRDVEPIEVQIFDRWGRPVHSSTTATFDNLWDGQVSPGGNEASEGVYWYYLRYRELSRSEDVIKEVKGNLTLLR